jgi:hypothetical protein
MQELVDLKNNAVKKKREKSQKRGLPGNEERLALPLESRVPRCLS